MPCRKNPEVASDYEDARALARAINIDIKRLTEAYDAVESCCELHFVTWNKTERNLIKRTKKMLAEAREKMVEAK